MIGILKMLADWARPLWCMTTYGDEDQILASPLQNMRTNLFRMDPQFRLKTNKQKQVKLILCVDKKRAGRRTCESWSSVLEPGLDDSLPAQQWPSGMFPFPALCTNWSQVFLPRVWLSCLISTDAECDVGVVTRIWNGSKEITHWGQVHCFLSRP